MNRHPSWLARGLFFQTCLAAQNVNPVVMSILRWLSNGFGSTVQLAQRTATIGRLDDGGETRFNWLTVGFVSASWCGQTRICSSLPSLHLCRLPNLLHILTRQDSFLKHGHSHVTHWSHISFSVTANEVQNSYWHQPLFLQALLLNAVSPDLDRLCSHHTKMPHVGISLKVQWLGLHILVGELKSHKPMLRGQKKIIIIKHTFTLPQLCLLLWGNFPFTISYLPLILRLSAPTSPSARSCLYSRDHRPAGPSYGPL